MHLLFVTLTDDPLDPAGIRRYGGAQQFMFDLGRYLVRRGHNLVFVTRKSRADKPAHQDLGPRCRVYRPEIGPLEEVSHHDLWELRDEFSSAVVSFVSNEAQFDAVLSYNWISGLAAAKTGIEPHIHHILSLGRVRQELKEESHPSDNVRDHCEIELFNRADTLVCACRDELNALRNLYPEVKSSNATVIPYGVDPNVFRPRPREAHAYLRRKAERFQEGLSDLP